MGSRKQQQNNKLIFIRIHFFLFNLKGYKIISNSILIKFSHFHLYFCSLVRFWMYRKGKLFRPDKETLKGETVQFDLMKWQTYTHTLTKISPKKIVVGCVDKPIKMEQNFIIKFSACNWLYQMNFIFSIFSSQCRRNVQSEYIFIYSAWMRFSFNLSC